MKKILLVGIILVVCFSCIVYGQEEYKLPEPKLDGGVSVEEAINARKSVRSFSLEALSINDVSQVLWAAGGATVDGVTGPTRAYPSAGGVYPLEVYLVAGKVTGLPAGIYYYNWKKNSLKEVKRGDVRVALAKAALGQRMIKDAPATIVVTARYDKIARAYGQRGVSRYLSMDVGHMGENVHLQTQSLGLGTVMVGAFSDKQVEKIIGAKGEEPIYMMPIGHIKK